CRLGHLISCVQSQLITCKQGNGTCTLIIRALMISVAPAVPPVSALCQWPHISAYQCTSVPFQCPSELPFSATYQCQSMLPISVHQCRLSVSVSDACQCPSVPPTSASSSVPITATYQCPSV
ncbi:unnamed protein product, partial [Staurois parvus]